MNEDEGRHFFIGVGTGRYRELGEAGQLPRVASDVKSMREICSRFGYEPVLLGLGEYDSAAQIREKLSLWAADADLTSKDVVLLYFAGHGVSAERDRHYLLCWDSRRDDYAATALPTEDLVRVLCQGELRHLLIVLDTCAGGAGSADAAEVALQSVAYRWSSGHAAAGLWFLASAQHEDEAIDGGFVTGLNAAIRVATERTGQRQRYIDLTELVKAVNEWLGHRGRRQRAVLAGGLITGLAPFIPNIGFRPDLPPLGTDLEVQRRVAEQELHEHFGPRSRGVEFESEQGLYFSGRDRALGELVRWLTADEGDGRGRVVTGSPGCGKSAVLGRIVALSVGSYRAKLNLSDVDPATIIPEGWVTAGVHARHKRLPQIVQRIAHALDADADSPTALLQELSRRGRNAGRPLVIVVDALDEAGSGTSTDADGRGEPRRIARELLRPISEIPGVRLLVGTRRELISSLGPAITVIDLDKPDYRADEDLAGYVRKVLLAAEEPDVPTPYRGKAALAEVVAKGVAKRADGVFLVARMTARGLRFLDKPVDVRRPGWEKILPSEIGEAFDDYLARFGADEGRVRRMLLPLAFAEGLGLPRGQLWTALSTGLSHAACTEEDVSWALTKAQDYIAEVVEDGRSAYRLYHQALAEHMRATAGRPVGQIQAMIVDALISIVPVTAERQAPDWFSAPPYIKSYLATHARAADRLAPLIRDPGFLLASGQLALLSALPSISDDEGRRIRTAYEQVAHRLTAAHPLSGRAADLQLSARRCGSDALAQQIGDLGIPLPWLAGWAWWSRTGAHRQLSGHQSFVECVAVATLDGHPIAITGSGDGTAKVWDLVTQQQIGADLQIGVTVSAVAVGDLDDYTVALTGGVDGTVRVWDLSTGLEHGAPLTGHTSRINAIAFRTFAGLPVVLTASGDGTARIWDLGNRVQIGSALTAHRRSVRAAALGELDGRPIGMTGGDDKRLYIWGLADVLKGGQASEAGRLIGFAGAVRAVALGYLADRLVAVAGDETGMLSVWDVAERQQVGEPVVAHKYLPSTRGVESVAIGELGGSQVVLSSGAFDARLWDLGGLRQLGHPLRGHVASITAAALSVDGETPMAVTVSYDQTARIWDLTADQPATGHVQGVRAVAFAEVDGRPLALTGGSDGTARLWDLRTRSEVGVPMEGHAGDVLAVAIGSSAGRPVAVTGGSDAAIRFWDPQRGTQAGSPIEEHTNAIRCVELAELDGRAVVVTASEDGTIRLWDATSRERLGQPLTGHIGVINHLAVLGTEAGLEIAAVTSLDHAYLWQVNPDPVAGTMKAHLGPDSFAAIWCIAGVTFDRGQPVALVSNSDNSLQPYNIRTGEPIAQPMIGHKEVIWQATTGLLGDETAVATVGYDEIRLWALGSNRPVGEPILGDLERLSSFTFAQVDGSPVGLVAFRREFRMWDLTTLQPVKEPLCGNNDRITGVSIVPTSSGQVVITGGDDGSLRAHSLENGQQIAAHITSSRPIHASTAMTTDSGIIVAASNYTETNVWNHSTRGRIGAIRDYGGIAYCLALCRLQDGLAIVIGTRSAEVHAWDLENWAPVCAPMLGHTAAVRDVRARVIDGKPKVASASDDGTVRFWDMETGQEAADLLGGHDRGASAVDIGKLRGGLVALTGTGDGLVRMWDLESGQSLDLDFERHPDRIAAVRLQDIAGQPFAISADSNGLVRAWNLTAGRLHAEVQVGSGINDIAVNSDGDLCVATNMGLVALRLDLATASASKLTRAALSTRRWVDVPSH